MPFKRETVSAGGTQYGYPFVDGPRDVEQITVDLSTLTYADGSGGEVDADGYLIPGTPLKKDGSLVARHPGLKQVVIAGGAAGAHTVTGIGASDRIVSVMHDTTAEALVDLTSEFTVSAANTIDNTSGTATTSDFLIVTYEPVDAYVYGVVTAPVYVGSKPIAADTDLDSLTDIQVAVSRSGLVSRDIIEDNLGRALSANEIAAFAAAGSSLMLSTT